MNIAIVLRLSDDLLNEVDKAAKEQKRSRNNFLNKIIKEAIEELYTDGK